MEPSSCAACRANAHGSNLPPSSHTCGRQKPTEAPHHPRQTCQACRDDHSGDEVTTSHTCSKTPPRPCAACGEEIGNSVFTICDTCWPLHGPGAQMEAERKAAERREGFASDDPAKRLSWLRTGLTMVLDLPSDTSDLEILSAVAAARNAEVGDDDPAWPCDCGNKVMGPQCTVCKTWRSEAPP